jgi:hypothetical protein
LSTAALDVSVILTLSDYSQEQTPTEKIVNGCELAVESIYLYSFFFGKTLIQCLENCLDGSEEEERQALRH